MNNDLTWLFGEKIDPALINSIETKFGFIYPEAFKRIALENDGASPNLRVFEAGNKTEVFNNLLSFSLQNDCNAAVVFSGLQLPKGIFPFAEDSFGNYICFDYRESKTEPKIVFYDHEIDYVDDTNFWLICESFEKFIDLLEEE